MPEPQARQPQEPTRRPGADALERLPSRRFLLTAAHAASRNGMLVSRVQHCADEPPIVAVSVRKGHPLSPLIRDTAVFGLAELRAGDRVLARKFEAPVDLHAEDPFLGHPLVSSSETRGLPIPRGIAAWMSCELVRHLDIEADHELYVGRVVAGGVFEVAAAPIAHAGTTNGTAPIRPGVDARSPLPVNGHAHRHEHEGRASV